MRQCTRCASELSEKDKVCPRCGLPVDKMTFDKNSLSEEMINQSKSENLNKAQRKEKKRLAKLAKKEEKRKNKEESKVSKTDFSQFASNASQSNVTISKKGKRNRVDQFQFEVDENGEFNINTKDVEIVGEEIAKAYEDRVKKQEYSIKKARGDYRPPKIKWWELYKLADRSFARRKIKKDVTKAAKMKPDFVSKTKLFLLALFFGWFGAHNFYAKNKKKGFVSLTFFLISFISLTLNDVAFFKNMELWLIGFTGFVVVFIWITDLVNILFNKFEYRIQKDKFISCLNIETRAKLGEKYIDLELLKKPWWVRFKVWFDKKKKGYYEWRQERRQRLIEREKAKLEAQEEKDKINDEIAKAEEKELKKIKENKSKEKNTVKETEKTEVFEPKKLSNNRKAKISVKTDKNKKK